MFIKAIANLGVGGVLALCLSASVAGVVQAPRVPTGADANVIAAFLANGSTITWRCTSSSSERCEAIAGPTLNRRLNRPFEGPF